MSKCVREIFKQKHKDNSRIYIKPISLYCTELD